MNVVERIVRVLFKGDDQISPATKQAEGGLSGFASKVPGWAVAVGGLTVAYKTVSAAIGAVKDFVLDSFVAFDNYTASQNKLAAQSKLTGVSIDDLNAAAKRARDEFGLSSAVANDAATTTAKYAARAGDATKQNELLAGALNLGAASGLTAAESMEALEMGLRGQDEGFDKLLGKNPSTIWKEYADANDLAVGKMTDTQKRMAELTAVVDAGNKVGDAYNDRLQSAAGQQELMNNKLENAKIAFGAALQPVRMLVIQGLSALIEIAAPVVLWLGRIANTAGLILGVKFQELRETIGNLASAFGGLIRNSALKQWGEDTAAAAVTAKTAILAMGSQLNEGATSAANHALAHETASTRIVASAKTNAEKTEESIARMNTAIDQKIGRPLAVVVGMTETAIRSLADAANAQLPPASAEKFETHMQGLAERAKEVAERITAVPPALDKGKASGKALADEIGTVARGASDAAAAFGVIDEKAAAVLTSATNIATAIGQIAGGNVFAGVAGLLGGVANIVSTIVGGDAERRQLLKDNSRALDKLRSEGVPLSSKASGENIAKAKTALTGSIFSKVGGFGQVVEGGGINGLIQLLSKNGLALSDLDKIASDLGMNIRDKNGGVDFNALKQLIEGLQTPGFGTSIGQSFTDQLKFFRETQDLSGAEGATKISDLLSYLTSVGKASALSGIDLNDPSGALSRLFGLRTQLLNGTLDSGALGNLTGQQFSDLLSELIRDIQSLGDGGASVGLPPASPGAGPGEGGTGGGSELPPTPTVDTKTLGDVIDSILTQTEADASYQVSSLSFMSRTADATEATAVNTGAALELLAIIANGVTGGDQQRARAMAEAVRLYGSPQL